jgi:hypothetical protein
MYRGSRILGVHLHAAVSSTSNSAKNKERHDVDTQRSYFASVGSRSRLYATYAYIVNTEHKNSCFACLRGTEEFYAVPVGVLVCCCL